MINKTLQMMALASLTAAAVPAFASFTETVAETVDRVVMITEPTAQSNDFLCLYASKAYSLGGAETMAGETRRCVLQDGDDAPSWVSQEEYEALQNARKVEKLVSNLSKIKFMVPESIGYVVDSKLEKPTCKPNEKAGFHVVSIGQLPDVVGPATMPAAGFDHRVSEQGAEEWTWDLLDPSTGKGRLVMRVTDQIQGEWTWRFFVGKPLELTEQPKVAVATYCEEI